ncbi:ribosome assembly RNA-binding protein YhbY [Facklamia miroungae]|uniref:RNA-binding protein n=1 Tax=Facklamia miroungae TaxID=120956 RepID=A0A1G7UJV3_9LACT|nr:ribosome assembly RNA-binding protein YhbY [Facklamia miroungae]NKZ30088.1 ribosome assembly RNA-binding protein YhbY [Facklamia miroungae]SDG47369.1 RNA-binding protein [Facklamia miroungae]
MTVLNKKQIKFLRKKAQKEKPIFQVGKLGVTDVFIQQVNEAIEKRELVKFNILQNSDEEINQAAEQIAESIDAVIIQTVGHTAILYRPSRKEKYQRLSEEIANIQ